MTDLQEPVHTWLKNELQQYEVIGFTLEDESELRVKSSKAARDIILSIAGENIQQLTLSVSDLSALDARNELLSFGNDYLRAFKV